MEPEGAEGEEDIRGGEDGRITALPSPAELLVGKLRSGVAESGGSKGFSAERPAVVGDGGFEMRGEGVGEKAGEEVRSRSGRASSELRGRAV